MPHFLGPMAEFSHRSISFRSVLRDEHRTGLAARRHNRDPGWASRPGPGARPRKANASSMASMTTTQTPRSYPLRSSRSCAKRTDRWKGPGETGRFRQLVGERSTPRSSVRGSCPTPLPAERRTACKGSGAVPPLWRNRDFVLLQAGQLLSTAGTSLTTIAYPLLALALTDSAAKAGLVTFARLAPSGS
jgi:hypothetical protein